MVFITGATGGIGTELCRLLAKDKIPARAMCRREAQMPSLQSLDIETVLANFDDVASLRKAMQGCNKLFLLTSPDEQHAKRECAIIDIAVETGIQYIIRISTADANLSAKLAYARSHAAIDHYLRSKPIQWTILRPTGFMQNFIESAHLIATGILPHMMDEGQISYIDHRDIALVSKNLITEAYHTQAIYFLTGPASLTVNDTAAILTKTLGLDVFAKNISEIEMRKALGCAGLSSWHIDALIEQFIIAKNGGEIDVTEEVKRLTGQAPRSFEQFVQDYKNYFLQTK